MAKIVAAKNETKKEFIIKKAASLFRKKGFVGSSMREIAEIIGVEASSLYNHIGSKNELLQTICFKIANDFTNYINTIEKEKLSTTKKLERLIQFHIEMMMNSYDEVFVANHEWKQLQEPFLSNFLNQRKVYEKDFIEIIKMGIQKKEIQNLDPHVIAFTILSAVRGLEFWQQHKKNISLKTLEYNMIHQLLKGITK
jgi:AcrR family transcriptional regulator